MDIRKYFLTLILLLSYTLYAQSSYDGVWVDEYTYNWIINNVDNMESFFLSVGSNTNNMKFIADNWKISNVKNMSNFFNFVGRKANINFEYSLDNWNLKNVENMNSFFHTFGLNSKSPVTLDLSEWDTSNTTNMGAMFSNAYSLKTIYVSDKFDTSKVTNMSQMFMKFKGSIQTLDLKDKFYTTSATNMTNMFAYCGATAMTVLDLGPAFTKIPDGTITFQYVPHFINCFLQNLI